MSSMHPSLRVSFYLCAVCLGMLLPACSPSLTDGPHRTIVLHVKDASSDKPLEAFWIAEEYDVPLENPDGTRVSTSYSRTDTWVTAEEEKHAKEMAVLEVTPPDLDVDVRIFATDREMQCLHFPGGKSGDTTEMDISLKPDPGITVCVKDGQGKPVPGAVVQYVQDERSYTKQGVSVFSPAGPIQFSRIPREVGFSGGPVTNDSGMLHLPLPCGEIRRLDISAPEMVNQRLEIPTSGDVLDVTLRPGTDLTVKVRSGGRPVPALTLHTSADVRQPETMTDENGVTHILGLGEGPLKIHGYGQLSTASIPTAQNGGVREFIPNGELSLALDVSRLLEIKSGAPAELNIDLPALAENTFKVAVTPDGDASQIKYWYMGYVVVVNAEGVRLEGRADNTVPNFSVKAPKKGSMLLMLTGMVSREQVWHGRLVCDLEQMQRGTLEVPVRLGKTTLTGDLAMNLAGKHGMVRAIDKRTLDVLGASGVWEQSVLMNEMIGHVSEEGKFTIPSIPPGDYDLYLTLFEGERAEKMNGTEAVVLEQPLVPRFLGSITVPDEGVVHFASGK